MIPDSAASVAGLRLSSPDSAVPSSHSAAESRIAPADMSCGKQLFTAASAAPALRPVDSTRSHCNGSVLSSTFAQVNFLRQDSVFRWHPNCSEARFTTSDPDTWLLVAIKTTRRWKRDCFRALSPASRCSGTESLDQVRTAAQNTCPTGSCGASIRRSTLRV